MKDILKSVGTLKSVLLGKNVKILERSIMELEKIEEADSESLSKRKDDIWDQLKETFGCNSDIIAELCEIERELTKRETG